MDRHKEDSEFIQWLKTATLNELQIYLRFQCCESWMRSAVERAIERKKNS